jgi:hypothetical protein
LTGGSGWRDTKTGQARIEWDGTFTVVYYDGLTYFWVEDPVLTVSANGSAELAATAGGYGMPREGGAWSRHQDTPVVLGQSQAPAVSLNGLTLKHDYADRAVRVPDGAPTQRLGAESNTPGAWPQSFVDFQGKTGLHSYWYSSGAAIDFRKPPDLVYISWDAAQPLAATVVTPSRPSSGALGWSGGSNLLGSALPKAATQSAPGGAGAATDTADPWGLRPDPVALAKATKDLVPKRVEGAGTSIAVRAAILTLLVSASVALIAWRRGWFRLQPKGIVS